MKKAQQREIGRMLGLNVVGVLAMIALTARFAAADEEKKDGAKKDERPNILFIYTDDHSYRTVGCYPQSYPWVRTPNIDQLGERRDAVRVRLHRHLVHAVAGHAADRASPVRRRVDADGRRSIPAATTIPRSARSGRPCSAAKATSPPRSASGTRASTPATAATGIFRLSGTGPPTPTRTRTTTTISRSRTRAARRRSSNATRPISTPTGRSTSFAAKDATSRNRGTCGFATARCTAPIRPPIGI